MLELKKADINLFEDLKKLFEESFNLKKNEVDFFFENKFKLDNCITCLRDGKLTSALHMFYNNIICKNSKKCKAYYLYGAATFPQYRNQGFMTKTINFANSLALNENCKYSVLLPENENLMCFYEKIGYQSFFKTNFLKFNCDNLKKIVDFEKLYNTDEFGKFEDDIDKFNYLNFEKIREKFYNSLYDVFWDTNSIKFAIKENNFCRGKVILRENSYAICHYQHLEKDTVEILELALSDSKNTKELKFLICSILKLMPAKKYVFRVPVNRLELLEIFCDDKKTKSFGMIKGLEKIKINLSNVKKAPYLGLTLD